jgi:two-component system chemotaxis response regulator CheB
MKKILIVDDSALVRKQLSQLVDEIGGFEIDTAKDGQEAVIKCANERYNVVTMDINMPKMDGLSAVQEIMKNSPMPILMVSSLTTKDAEITMDALDAGAVDFVAKPGTFNVGLQENETELISKIRSLSRMSNSRILRRKKASTPSRVEQKERNSSTQLREQCTQPVTGALLVGASTGGPGLLDELCASLPVDFPYPVVIVQHMPEKFTAQFAERLNNNAKLNVVEAEHNMQVCVGNIYLAPGGKDIDFFKKVSGKITIRLDDEAKANRYFMPSVDEMMHNAQKVFDPKSITAVILTGIGEDGAEAMVELKKRGAYTIAESEKTAFVYGMPRAAMEAGGVSEQLPFPSIVRKISTLR